MSFLLLGAYTGAIVNIVSMVRSLWFFLEERNGKRTWLSLTVVLVLVMVATTFTYQDWVDFLPLIGGLVYAFACWQKNILLYRYCGILVSILYIVYDIYFKSIFGVVGESVAIVCALVGLIIDAIKKGKNKTITVESVVN